MDALDPRRFLLVLLIWLPNTAFAQSADAAARAHFASARAYFERGEYEPSLREFQEAYRLSGRIDLLYNISLAYERSGAFELAAEQLETYARARPDLDPEARAALAQRVAELRQRASSADASESVPATSVPSGAVQVSGQSSESDDVSLGLVLGISGLALAGAALVAFGITAGLAAAENEHLTNTCGSDAGRTCSDSQVATLAALTTTADVSLVVCLIFGAAGATALLVDVLADGPTRVSLTPMWSGERYGVQVRARW